MMHTAVVGSPSTNRLLSEAEVRARLADVDGWQFEDGRLRRDFVFRDFSSAMAFMVEVAFEAERLGHHPNWSNVYNKVNVEIWSHDLGGVSELCVALARTMDEAARG